MSGMCDMKFTTAGDLHIDGIKNYKDCEKPNEWS